MSNEDAVIRRMAKDLCKREGVAYLSHEVYGNAISIAVSDCGERYEISRSLDDLRSQYDD